MTLTASSAAMAKRPGRYGDGRGLYLVIQPSGSKSWILRMQQAGFRTDRGLGSYPTVSLAEARKLAEARRVMVRQANGHAPRKDRQPSDEAPRGASSWSKSPTFEQVARRFHETNVGAGGWTNNKNISAWMGRAKKHLFPIIGRLPIDQVTVNQIRDDILIPTALSKPETAKRLRIIIRQTFEYAMESGFANANPIDRIPSKRLPMPMPMPMAALRYQDVPKALRGLKGDRNPHEPQPWPVTLLCFELLILTAVRSNEARGMTWDEIDLDAGLWEIPASRMKQARPHRIPLSRQAIALLTKARDELGGNGSGIVFPHPTTGRQLSENALSDQAEKDRMGAVPHGFRSSFRTWAAEQSGASFDAAELALAHNVGNATTRSYFRTDLLDERRPMMQAWADYLLPLPF